MREVAQELEDTNTSLEKELDETLESLNKFERKAEELKLQQSQEHQALLSGFTCHWTSKDDKDGNLWFILMTGIVPLLQIVLIMFWTEQLEALLWWPYPILAILMIVGSFYWDRRRCFTSGRQPYFLATPTYQSYEYVKTCSGRKFQHGDERPEHQTVTDVKYEAYYAKFNYKVTKHHGTYKKQNRRIVSVELLVQLIANTRIMSLANSEQVTEERMRQTAAAFKCINISKFRCLEQDIVENTLAVAMGCWKRNLRRRFGHF
jgi:hypothetical protein